MTNEQEDRLVIAFESIAKSLAGLNENASKAGSRFWPEARQPRDAVVTRIPTEEDLAREAQGVNQPIGDWLKLPKFEEEEEEIFGEREREFLEEKKRNASAKEKGPGSDGAEAIGSDAAATSGEPPSDPAVQAS